MEVLSMLFLLDLILLSQLCLFSFCVATVGTFTCVSMKRIGLFAFSSFVDIEH